MLYFKCRQLGGGGGGGGQGGWTFAQRPTSSLTSRGKSFYRQSGEGLPTETAQSSLTLIFKLVTGGLTSMILFVLGRVNLQFQSPFFPISLSPILRIVAASPVGTAWSSCS